MRYGFGPVRSREQRDAFFRLRYASDAGYMPLIRLVGAQERESFGRLVSGGRRNDETAHVAEDAVYSRMTPKLVNGDEGVIIVIDYANVSE